MAQAPAGADVTGAMVAPVPASLQAAERHIEGNERNAVRVSASAAVPEPGSVALLVAGLVSMAAFARRRGV